MALTVFSLNHHQMHYSSVQYKFPLPLHVLIITKFVFLALLSLSRELYLFDNHCCNTDLMPVALWEVDGPEGHITGVPNSMYLVTGIFLSLFPPHVFSHGPTVGAGWVYSSLLRTMHH
jgi:hypothetical protein